MPTTKVKSTLINPDLQKLLHKHEVIITASEDVEANSEYELPENFTYRVGDNLLSISVRGTIWYRGINFEEIGDAGTISNKVKLIDKVEKGDILNFSYVMLQNHEKES